MIKANDVFNIAKHFDFIELIKLNTLIEEKIFASIDIKVKKHKKIPSQKEMIKYLLETHFNKNKLI